MDPRAMNYNEDAKKPCHICCEFLNDTIRDTVYKPIYGDSAALVTFQQNFIGRWQGTATSPWVDPYAVEIEFFENNQYSAQTTDGSGTTAFYYGSDEDHPSKICKIKSFGMARSGELTADADIYIYFSPNSIVLDELQDIKFVNDYDHLQFRFIHNGRNGPILYDLERK